MGIKELSDGNSSGTRLGQDSSDLVGFHGATPSDQAATISALATAATVGAVVTAVNSLLTALKEKGLIASS